MQITVISCLFFLLIACNSTEEIDYKKINDGRYTIKTENGKEVVYIDDNDLVPPVPDEDKNDETLAGIDVDKDGVRDDIEVWINLNIDKKPQRLVLKEYSRNLRLELINHESQADVLTYHFIGVYARSCFAIMYGKKFRESWKITDQLIKKIFNTNKRRSAKDHISEQLNGAIYTEPDDPCQRIGVKYDW